METRRILRFGDYTLDLEQRLLFRADGRIRLTPKLIALLILLVERRGEVVTRNEIIRTLWPDTIVEESGLARNISMLRKHLAASDGAQYIENIPKRGYRFTAEVTVATLCERPASPPEATCELPESTLGIGALANVSAALRKRPSPSRTAIVGLFVAVLSAVLIAFVAVGERGDEPALYAQRVTTNSGALPIVSASVSPNGRALAYIEASDASTVAYVRDLRSPRVHALAQPAGVAPASVHWFADNTRLLLSGFDPQSKRHIAWSVSREGGQPKIVLEDAHKIALSSDGQQLAFYRRQNELWLARPDGTAQRSIALAPDSTRFTLRPRFTSDRKHLIVGRATHLPYSPIIEAHRLSDGKVTQLFDPNGQAVLDMLPLFSGELLIVLREGYSGSRLLTMRVDFEKGRTSTPSTLQRFDDLVHGLGVTADGTQFTAIRAHSQPDVYVGALSESGTSLTAVRRLTLDTSWDRPASWLDDRTIVFHSNRHGTRGIYKQQIDALHAEPMLVDEGVDNFWPVITPNGQWMWYFSVPGKGEWWREPVKLMRRSVSGGTPREFDARRNLWRSLHCATHGACVLMEHVGEEAVFYSFDPESARGSELARVPLRMPLPYFAWDLSPDGKRVTFVDVAKNAAAIVHLEKNSRVSDVQIDACQSLRGVAWNAKGTGLYVVCSDEDESRTLHVTLDGEIALLRHQPLRAGAWAKPSADGRHLLLADFTKVSNVWLFSRM